MKSRLTATAGARSIDLRHAIALLRPHKIMPTPFVSLLNTYRVQGVYVLNWFYALLVAKTICLLSLYWHDERGECFEKGGNFHRNDDKGVIFICAVWSALCAWLYLSLSHKGSYLLFVSILSVWCLSVWCLSYVSDVSLMSFWCLMSDVFLCVGIGPSRVSCEILFHFVCLFV
jgi:hypothetical protein